MKDFSLKTWTREQPFPSPKPETFLFKSKWIHSQKKNLAYTRTSLCAARPFLAPPVTDLELAFVATGGSQRSLQELWVEMLLLLLCVVPVARVSTWPAVAEPWVWLGWEVGTGHRRQRPLLEENQSTGALSRRSQPGNAGLNSHRGLKGVSALVCRLLYDLPSTFTDASFSSSDNLLQGPEKWV